MCKDPQTTPLFRKDEKMRLYNIVKSFLQDDDGPTAVEYAVMLALIVVFCIGAITTLGQKSNNVFSNVGTRLVVP